MKKKKLNQPTNNNISKNNNNKIYRHKHPVDQKPTAQKQSEKPKSKPNVCIW